MNSRVLREHGASLWLRHLPRRLGRCVQLERLLSEGVVGAVESDVGLMQAALSDGRDYQDALAALAGEADSAHELAELLIAEDAKLAADKLARLFEQTDGLDGYVSVDVPTSRTDDAEAMTSAVHRLVAAIDRPNVMVKIPPTESGLAVIEAMTAEGYHVHINPLLSVASYRMATEAYANGLQRFAAEGGDGRPVVSAASFQLAPIDVVVDDILRDRIRDSERDTSRLESLSGSAAIAVAKLVHGARVELLGSVAVGSSEPFPQRLVWSHAIRRDPRFPSLRYLESLVGPSTAVSLPLATLLGDRTELRMIDSLESDAAEAVEILDELADAGIDVPALATQIEDEAIVAQASRYADLLGVVESLERSRAAGRSGARSTGLSSAVEKLSVDPVPTSLEPDLVERIWAKDASLWVEPEEERELIRNRLGWLDIVEPMLDEHRSALRFAEEIEASDVEHVVLLGMGGSSLCADVCRRIFDVDNFMVLDSTIPAAVGAIADRIDPARTLVLVSSKSGVTPEVRALTDLFFARATPMLENPGERFVALTDPGTPLEQLADDRGFRRLWLTPPDVGGRFSALSHFGMVPLSLMGVGATGFLESAQRMVVRCSPDAPLEGNPAVHLGNALHGAYQNGRDKLTLLASDSIAPLGDWIEQLVAESTGKLGKGIVPVVAEPLGTVDSYGPDRLFVAIRWAKELEAGTGELPVLAEHLEAAGHPVVHLVLEEPEDLGGEFFRWELAVAVAAALMGVNPFDEPDVRDSKRRTAAILESLATGQAVEQPTPLAMGRRWTLFADLERDGALGSRLLGDSLADWLTAHIGRAEPPDYFGLQAFLEPSPAVAAMLQEIRGLVRDRLGVATTLGWGPRFLHSTGQLHKGGSDRGVFLQITADPTDDIDCPGSGYSFGALARAQALGDFETLLSRGRRVVRVHLSDADAGVAALVAAMGEAFGP